MIRRFRYARTLSFRCNSIAVLDIRKYWCEMSMPFCIGLTAQKIFQYELWVRTWRCRAHISANKFRFIIRSWATAFNIRSNSDRFEKDNMKRFWRRFSLVFVRSNGKSQYHWLFHVTLVWYSFHSMCMSSIYTLHVLRICHSSHYYAIGHIMWNLLINNRILLAIHVRSLCWILYAVCIHVII